MTDSENQRQRHQLHVTEAEKRAIKTVTVTMTEVLWQRLVELAAKFTPWSADLDVNRFIQHTMQAECELANDIIDDIAVLKEIIR